MTQKKRKSSTFAASNVAAAKQHYENTLATSFLFSAFDLPKAEYFAAVLHAVDAHRVSVWDTRSSSLVVSWSAPTKNTKFTCLAWGRESPNKVHDSVTNGVDVQEEVSTKKNKKSNKHALQQSRLVAVGTANGEVLIYSLTHGTLQTTLTSGSPVPISDFAFSASDSFNVGYSVASNGELIKWDLLKGTILAKGKADVNSLSKVLVDGSGRVLVAGTGLKLFDGKKLAGSGATFKALKEFTGHATSVVSMKFTSSASLCVSAASQDRFVSVWNCDSKDTQAVNVTALTLETPPTQVSVSSKDQVLVLNEQGILSLWSSASAPATTTPTPSKKARTAAVATRPAESTITFKVSDNGQEPRKVSILAATFADDKIAVAYGNTLRPTFERIPFLDTDGNLVKPVEHLREDIGTGVLAQKGTLAEQDLRQRSKLYNESQNATVLDGNAELIPDFSADASDSNEPTLEEKLNTMQIDASTAPAAKKSKAPFRAPTATSLYAMLSQAIQSSDKQLLEKSLMVNDGAVILATVRRLPPAQIVPFLEMLVSRLQAKPNRGSSLIEWVRAVVVSHAAFLMTNPVLVKQLGTLYSTLDARVGTFHKMLRLSGRLDLVMSQITMRSARARFDDEDDDENQDANAAVYNEEEDEDEDEEMEEGEEWDEMDDSEEDDDEEEMSEDEMDEDDADEEEEEDDDDDDEEDGEEEEGGEDEDDE
ncbi:WD repeat-containing protein 43 [Chytridiales sp. JEL 0842]|nr:WD repeat-containing protein 43 [Chytridiales sp. JEL 0842]